jgi:hypothetical protein
MENKLLILPRGCLDQVLQILKILKINYVLEVKTNNGKKINIKFTGKLKK